MISGKLHKQHEPHARGTPTRNLPVDDGALVVDRAKHAALILWIRRKAETLVAAAGVRVVAAEHPENERNQRSKERMHRRLRRPRCRPSAHSHARVDLCGCSRACPSAVDDVEAACKAPATVSAPTHNCAYASLSTHAQSGTARQKHHLCSHPGPLFGPNCWQQYVLRTAAAARREAPPTPSTVRAL
jgi:hypothetical protein